MNIVIWDIETDSSNTFFGTIIEIGAILMNDNFQELDRLNIRCRLPEGTIPQAGALLVNQSNVSLLTKANYSHYQMLQEVEQTFKKWSLQFLLDMQILILMMRCSEKNFLRD